MLKRVVLRWRDPTVRMRVSEVRVRSIRKKQRQRESERDRQREKRERRERERERERESCGWGLLFFLFSCCLENTTPSKEERSVRLSLSVCFLGDLITFESRFFNDSECIFILKIK